ncbi:MAG: hypothetical protein DRI48_01950 [Chloroflexi bacterium]|nr:MAG: hypothetical protein DRI48_01950 [Chloroflexota bacterium]
MTQNSENPLALIIEDDPDAATIFSQALQAAEFEVETATTGTQALERLKYTAPAVVILDMHLPYVAGADILDYINTEPRLMKTQVIIITGDHELANDPALQQQGRVIQILVKPVIYSRLHDLAQLLKLSIKGGTP